MKGTVWRLGALMHQYYRLNGDYEDILLFETEAKMERYIKKIMCDFDQLVKDGVCSSLEEPSFRKRKISFDSKEDLCFSLSLMRQSYYMEQESEDECGEMEYHEPESVDGEHSYYQFMVQEYRNRKEREISKLQKEQTLAEETLTLSHKELYMKLVKKFHPDKANRKNQVDRFTRITKEVNRYNDLQATSKLREIYIQEMIR